MTSLRTSVRTNLEGSGARAPSGRVVDVRPPGARTELLGRDPSPVFYTLVYPSILIDRRGGETAQRT